MIYSLSLKKVAIYNILVLFFTWCGSESPHDENGNSIETGWNQEIAQFVEHTMLEPSTFMIEVNGDMEFRKLYELVRGTLPENNNVIECAGKVADQLNNSLLWGQFESVYTSIGKLCTGEGCSYIIQTVNGKEVIWKNKKGDQIDLPAWAYPVLLKEIPQFDFNEKTSLAQVPLDTYELPHIDVTKSRFILLNYYGKAWNYSFPDSFIDEKIVSGYDDVRIIEYASLEDIESLFKITKAGDVVIIVAPTVRMKIKSSGVYKPIGISANLSIWGDETWHITKIQAALAENPFRNLAYPSFLFILGAMSYNDGSSDTIEDNSLLTYFTRTHAIVSGISGFLNGKQIKIALNDFLLCLPKKLDFKLCLDSLNEKYHNIVKWIGNRETLPLLPPRATFWEDAVGIKPEKGDMTLFISVQNLCIDKHSGEKYTEDQIKYSQNLPLTIDTINGPVFHASQNIPENNVHVEITGRFLRLEKGEPFLFYLSGNVGINMQEITLYGLAKILRIEKKQDPLGKYLSIEFTGNVSSSSYTNEKGETCILKVTNETLETLSSVTSNPSWMRVYYELSP